MGAPDNVSDGNRATPGVVIQIVHATREAAGPIIEHNDTPVPAPDYFPNQCRVVVEAQPPPPKRFDAKGEPIFDPRRC
jgi:hypothetical protein